MSHFPTVIQCLLLDCCINRKNVLRLASVVLVSEAVDFVFWVLYFFQMFSSCCLVIGLGVCFGGLSSARKKELKNKQREEERRRKEEEKAKQVF